MSATDHVVLIVDDDHTMREALLNLLAASDLRDALGNKIGLKQFLAVIPQESIRCRVRGEHLPNML